MSKSRDWSRKIIWLLSMAAIAAGCGKTSGSKSAEFIFVTNGDSPFWDAAQKGWQDAGAESGRQVVFYRNTGGTAASQVRLLEQIAAQQDVKGVAVSIVDASSPGIIEALEKLEARGVQIVTVDSDCLKKDSRIRKAYIGTNNMEAGKVAGATAKLLLPAGGKVIGFVGNKQADNARARIEGFQTGAGEAFVLADVMVDDHDQSKARANVQAALSAHSDLAMPLGIYSYNAPMIAEAVADSGKRDKLKIVTFDAEALTMKAIADGNIDATIVQNTFDMGAIAEKLLDALVKKDDAKIKTLLPSGDQIDTGVRVIVPNNSPLIGKAPKVETYDDFQKYMKSKGLSST